MNFSRHSKAYFCPRCSKTCTKPRVRICGLEFWRDSWRDKSKKYVCSKCAYELSQWWNYPSEGEAEQGSDVVEDATQKVQRVSV